MSTREAQRHLSQLLDELENEESAVLIVRYGRPAAMLIPFEETGQAVKLPRISDLAIGSQADVEMDDIDDVRLSADQAWIVRDMTRCSDVNWSMDRLYEDWSKAPARLAELTRLELAGLVERDLGGLRLTRKGRRVARGLDSTS